MRIARRCRNGSWTRAFLSTGISRNARDHGRKAIEKNQVHGASSNYMNLFVLGIFEHIEIDLRPSVKTLLSKIETGSRSMVPHDARPHFARLPFVIG